eukprot:12263082-Alexandrium_andersonii.AAC.1
MTEQHDRALMYPSASRLGLLSPSQKATFCSGTSWAAASAWTAFLQALKMCRSSGLAALFPGTPRPWVPPCQMQ